MGGLFSAPPPAADPYQKLSAAVSSLDVNEVQDVVQQHIGDHPDLLNKFVAAGPNHLLHTPLMTAAKLPANGMIQTLLALNADPSVVGKDGVSALMCAIRTGNDRNALKLVEQQDSHFDDDVQGGNTLLMLAAANGCVGLLRELINCGASIGIEAVQPNGCSKTAWMLARDNRKQDCESALSVCTDLELSEHELGDIAKDLYVLFWLVIDGTPVKLVTIIIRPLSPFFFLFLPAHTCINALNLTKSSAIPPHPKIIILPPGACLTMRRISSKSPPVAKRQRCGQSWQPKKTLVAKP